MKGQLTIPLRSLRLCFISFCRSPPLIHLLFSLSLTLSFSSGVTVMMNMSIETRLVKEKMASKAMDLMMYGFVSYLPLRSVLTREVTFLFCEITRRS